MPFTVTPGPVRSIVDRFTPRFFRAPSRREEATTAAPATEPVATGKGRTIRAVAFAGGGFDTANQLGLIHAMVVGQCHPPDLVAGISAGAVNAVALAEVMHAGEPTSVSPDRAAQVARFREIFEAARNYPDELLRQILPDPFEVDARAPLKPQPLPLHFQEERNERLKAVNARFGLIRLFNDVLRVSLPISTVTKIVRRLLEIGRLAETPWPYMAFWRGWHLVALWLIVGLHLAHIAPVVTRLLPAAAFAGLYRRLLERIAKQRAFLRNPLHRANTALLKGFLSFWDFPAPATAQEVIRRRTIGRWLDAARNSVGFVVVLLAWAGVGYPVVFGGFHAVKSVNATRRWLESAPAGVELLLWILLWVWITVAALLLLLVASRRVRAKLRMVALKRLFYSYDLAQDLATPFAVKPFLVRNFDREYYGRNDIGRVVDQALAGCAGPARASATVATPKKLGDYAPDNPAPGKPRIHVRPLVADLKTGRLLPVAPQARVVDAMLAAGAVVPFFRPQRIEAMTDGGHIRKIFAIDGLNLSNDPLQGMYSLIAFLYKRRDPAIFGQGEDPAKHRIECYPVTSLPANAPPSSNAVDRVPLCDVVYRAVDLQRFRDAELGARLVDLFERVLPQSPFYSVKRASENKDDFVYVRAEICPIRPDSPPKLNQRAMLAENGYERRRIIAEGVADGCRAAMEVFLASTIRKMTGGDPEKVVNCRDVVATHLGTSAPLPGSEDRPGAGAGIPEVCRHCARRRGAVDPQVRSLGLAQSGPSNRTAANTDWPRWGAKDAEPQTITTNEPPPTIPPVKIPPTISMLFSGGVFRGVFQVGVVAALEQVGAKPHVMAGASVGSIMAAIAAEVFRTHDPDKRRRLVTDLAATFLCVDRLVMTDRFGDFVRRFTLRSAETGFSFRDADRFFRRFDEESAGDFSEHARRVVAGLERLFYLSPFALQELVCALRTEQSQEVDRKLRAAVQCLLERSGVGQEVLGAEPLEILLQHLVLDRHPGKQSFAFDFFKDPAVQHPLGGIHLLATATNLTTGRLEVLGLDPDRAPKTNLRDGLFASSAFPGVFRPRWSWEVYRDSRCSDQLIDGGVMDNLPIAAVIEFLARARNAGKIDRTGCGARATGEMVPTPHLLFTASLEPDSPELTDAEVEHAEAFWLWSYTRAKQLRYNKKITDFARAQTHFRDIIARRRAAKETLNEQQLPLDLEVACVMPKWLCGTFAFHPMIGFRRANQARSIAHGCASTLAKLHLVKKKNPAWVEAWGIDVDVEPGCVTADSRSGRETDVVSIKPMSRKQAGGSGCCWLRKGVRCPFSEEALRESRERDLMNAETAAKALSENQISELSEIHRYCGKRATHAAQGN